jgi:hypothetical protein
VDTSGFINLLSAISGAIAIAAIGLNTGFDKDNCPVLNLRRELLFSRKKRSRQWQ